MNPRRRDLVLSSALLPLASPARSAADASSVLRLEASMGAGTTPWVVAVDGQPSEPFQPLGSSLPVGPGTRFDLMLDMPASGAGEVRIAISVGSEPAAAMVFRPAGDPRAALPPNPRLPSEIRLEHATRATLVASRRDNTRPGDAVA